MYSLRFVNAYHVFGQLFKFVLYDILMCKLFFLQLLYTVGTGCVLYKTDSYISQKTLIFMT